MISFPNKSEALKELADYYLEQGRYDLYGECLGLGGGPIDLADLPIVGTKCDEYNGGTGDGLFYGGGSEYSFNIDEDYWLSAGTGRTGNGAGVFYGYFGMFSNFSGGDGRGYGFGYFFDINNKFFVEDEFPL